MAKHRNGTEVNIAAVAPQSEAETASVGTEIPVAVNALTAQKVGDLYLDAINLRVEGLAKIESEGLARAITAGDSFNLYREQESLTARGGAEAIEKATDGKVKAQTIRAYGRIADLASKVSTSTLLTVGSINSAQTLGFLTNPKISAEAAKNAVIAFVAGTKIKAIRENLNLPVALDSLEGSEFLVAWGSAHLIPVTEEDKEAKAKEEQFKQFKRIVKALDKHNLKEVVFGALLAEQARNSDDTVEDTEGFQGTIPEEPETELPKRPTSLVEIPKIIEPIASVA
jgi:hypothetical protein